MIITLTGFMGAGKSTIGKRLAGALDWKYVDLDKEIEKRTGKNVRQWFLQGEEAFRDAESATLEEMLQYGGDLVLALGGGAILREENRRMIKERSTCIYLQANPATLKLHIGDGKKRPVLKNGTVESILDARKPFYEEVADVTICTDDKSPAQVVDEIYYQI